MAFGETKVYFDGSHYIAIPHTTRPKRWRPKVKEEEITVIEKTEVGTLENSDVPSVFDNDSECNDNVVKITQEFETNDKVEEDTEKENVVQLAPHKQRKITRKELFNELYDKYIDLSKSKRKKKIEEEMLSYFSNSELCKGFVEMQFERKQRNLIARRVRMARKANLANFNYFCTFTYDSSLHTEETFKKKLRTCFRHLVERKNWKYMGVWERAPESNRLHFHGLFYIPENAMVGVLKEVKDYDTRSHRMRTTIQSSFFNEKFGRSDFEEIDENERRLGHALAYLMKYIEKTGEKIVYSKGLPQYFISDILDEDIVCTIGQEDKKLLLFDDFMCLDEGCFMGKVCPEVIEQMRKSN
ncbi:MAG: hypothetical protein IKN09_04025 [Clostridia bacterium]|nr:hypothetical protein [Clostridia bacterium]MBR4270138.1 hypothetical protein [Clostridia bacterium]